MNVYGFNKRETAKKLSRIASDDNVEYLTRRRPDRQPALLRGNLRFFYATPDGDIPAGTPLEPRRGMAFILRLNTDSEMMEKGQADGVDIDSVEVWNRGPAIMAGAANSLEPVISLQGDSHGNLWIQATTGKIAVRAPAGGLAAGATLMLPIFENAPGATMTPLFMVQNTWPVEVGNNDDRKLYIAMVEGDGDPDAYKVCTANCNEAMP